MSIIDDPHKRSKIVTLLMEVRKGRSLAMALERAGMDRDDLAAAIDEALRSLTRRVGGGGEAVAYCDGASRGNPGQAAAAVVICDRDGNELMRTSRLLGVTTNNVAEYEAVILALEKAGKLGARKLVLKLDSQLVANQLKGTYRVKHPMLQELYRRAKSLMTGFGQVEIEVVSRGENKEADRMANKALDRRRLRRS